MVSTLALVIAQSLCINQLHNFLNAFYCTIFSHNCDNKVCILMYILFLACHMFELFNRGKMKCNINSDGKLNIHPNELMPNSCKLNKSLND